MLSAGAVAALVAGNSDMKAVVQCNGATQEIRWLSPRANVFLHCRSNVSIDAARSNSLKRFT